MILNHHINKDNKSIKKMIEERRENFFLTNTLFPKLKKNLYYFKKLWRSGNLDKDEKEVIWKWVDTFVYLGEKIHKGIIKNFSSMIIKIPV